MSKLFFDQLLNLDKLDKTVKEAANTHDEKIELWQVIDEIIHHKVLHCVLDKLPKNYHKEFVERFTKAPYDEKLLLYLRERVKVDIESIIKEAVALVVVEILSSIGLLKRSKKTKHV